MAGGYVRVVPATLRDVTYIAANIRPEDWREIACQLSEEVTPTDVAAWSLTGREAWVATVRGQPVAAFGVHDATNARNVLMIWAWGTPKMWRAVPEMTRFIRERVEVWITEGVTRVEARSIEGHGSAHRWMRALGGESEPLPGWGKGGEDFLLFWWTQETWTSCAGSLNPPLQEPIRQPLRLRYRQRRSVNRVAALPRQPASRP